jgi:hypothetical protein
LNAINFGVGAETRYATVLGLLLVVQLLSVLWFARMSHGRH